MALGFPGVGVFLVSSFTGDLANTGKIAAKTGIAVFGGSVQDAIVDSGTISAAKHAILVSGGVVSGGIVIGSHGKISAGSSAVLVESAASFGGGITNSGSLSANFTGIVVIRNITSVAGDVVNSAGGVISAHSSGILVGTVQHICRQHQQCRHDLGG